MNHGVIILKEGLDRKFAQEYLKISFQFLKHFKLDDDVDFIEIINHFNFSLHDIASPYMYGHIHLKVSKNLNKCPSIIPTTKCYGNQLFPFQNLTGFHCSTKKNYIIFIILGIRFTVSILTFIIITQTFL